MINNRIKQLRRLLNLSQKDFSEKLGIGLSTLSMLEINKRKVLERHINLICKVFSINEDWLRYGTEPIFKNENKDEDNILKTLEKHGVKPYALTLIKTYIDMDDKSKEIFEKYIDTIIDKRIAKLNTHQKQSEQETSVTLDLNAPLLDTEDIQELKNIKLYQAPVSAGLGTWLDNDVPYEMLKVDLKTCPQARRCDFALKVRGDSMEPYYYDGDIVYIKEQPAVDNGQIGIFLYNNDSYIKKLSITKDTVFLISFNEKYKPIKINEDSNFKCFGLVL